MRVRTCCVSITFLLAAAICGGEEFGFDRLKTEDGTTIQPRVFSDSENSNLDEILEVVNAKQSPLIWTLQQQSLSEELELTPEQLKLLSRIKSRTAAEIQIKDLSERGDPYRLSKAALRDYTDDLSRIIDAELRESDKLVLATLDDEQQLRLKQIAFQEQLLSYRDARRALLYHGVRISGDQNKALNNQLYKADKKLKVFEPKLKHQLRLEILERELNASLGKPFYFDVNMTNTDECAEEYQKMLSEVPEKKTPKPNSRRRSVPTPGE